MLQKQDWKLLTNTDAIFTHVFKAKYFLIGDFLGAHLGHNPSYAWRSIYASQVVVKNGIRRLCVRNGSSINIWKDPLLRIPDNPYISSATPPGYDQLVVRDLINLPSSRWHQNTIPTLFNPYDIQAIQSIPLLHLDEPNIITWTISRGGTYTMMFAYYHIMENLISNANLKVLGNWKLLWKMKALHAMKIFL
uniref:Uncharacterized protein n=1 Tax=Cajanus cajan TaxID=3821 RepID=A0A151SYM4_CAJCA|nr:hypothetical protein KK1_015337 [Cajanus cajan]